MAPSLAMAAVAATVPLLVCGMQTPGVGRALPHHSTVSVEGDAEEVAVLDDSSSLLQTSAGTTEARRASTRVKSQLYRQPMQNHDDLAYTATVTVGGQEVQGILDTGSFELLVFSTTCGSCGSVASFYNHSRSGTHEHGFLMTMHSFGSGDTHSMLAYEDVSLGPLEVDRQYFWEVYSAQLPILHAGTFQAIVGVGPPASVQEGAAQQMSSAQAIVDKYEAHDIPIPGHVQGDQAAGEIMLAQSSLLENLNVHQFSVCLRRGVGEEGYFVWNDDAPQRLPDAFTQVDVLGGDHWAVDMRDVRLSGGPDDTDIPFGCSEGCGAVVDSGTSLILVPSSAANHVLNQINALETATCGDIRSFPDLSFEVGGHTFTMPPETYIGEYYNEIPEEWRPYAQKMSLPAKFVGCELLLMTMDVMTEHGPLWILGMPFFREFYTTFDFGGDFFDSSRRRLHIARADAECHVAGPAIGEGAGLVQHARATGRTMLPAKRRVDASKVRMPGWLHSAAVSGSLKL